MSNGGTPCQPMDVIPRNTDHKCLTCESLAPDTAPNQAADSSAQQLSQQPMLDASETMDTSNATNAGEAIDASKTFGASEAMDAGEAMDTSEG
jgi:hypothetical protein